MQIPCEPSWHRALAHEFSAPYFQTLRQNVDAAYRSDMAVFPPANLIFNAFTLCPYDQVRVVILGQDPYHRPGQAHGLSFSVQDGIPPPSLRNIYREITNDLSTPSSTNGDLSNWARQGVLLLNTILTVEESRAGSHRGFGWERFTDAVIKKLSDEKQHLVFLLWGRFAQEKGEHIDPLKHLILKAAHPSPLSAYNGFFGCRHFSQTNAYLEKHHLPSIVW